jgi:hypothetical protein
MTLAVAASEIERQLAAVGGGRSLFPLAISVFQHAIPTHIRPQVLDLALRGLIAMMVAMKLATLLWR